MVQKISFKAFMLFVGLVLVTSSVQAVSLVGKTFSGPDTWTGDAQSVSAGETFDSSWEIVLTTTLDMTFIFATTASDVGGVGETLISLTGTSFNDTLSAPSGSSSFSQILGPGTYIMAMSSTVGGLPLLGGSYNVGATASAVPLPAAAWLMGSALVGLVSFGRRKSGLTA